MPVRAALYPLLPKAAGDLLRSLSPGQAKRLEEVRFRANRKVELVFADGTKQLPLVLCDAQMDDLLASLTGHALYRCERQLAQGYIALSGGYRAGVCGRMTQEDGVLRMAQITSVCVRIARHVPGAGIEVYPHLLTARGDARHVLLLGPPGCGKTTVLRDCAIYLSDKLGLRVALADEREELTACLTGNTGQRIDILSGVEKAHAMRMIIRTMAPQVIVTDELGGEEDAQAVSEALRCGVGLVASAHAGSFEDAIHRPTLSALLRAAAFERCVLLGRHGAVRAVWDENGRLLEGSEEDEHAKLGYGRAGDDAGERHRILAL